MCFLAPNVKALLSTPATCSSNITMTEQLQAGTRLKTWVQSPATKDLLRDGANLSYCLLPV